MTDGGRRVMGLIPDTEEEQFGPTAKLEIRLWELEWEAEVSEGDSLQLIIVQGEAVKRTERLKSEVDHLWGCCHCRIKEDTRNGKNGLTLPALRCKNFRGMNSLHVRGLWGNSVLAVLLQCGIPSSFSFPEPPLKACFFFPYRTGVHLDARWLSPDPCGPHHYTAHLALYCQAVYSISPVSLLSTRTLFFNAMCHN